MKDLILQANRGVEWVAMEDGANGSDNNHWGQGLIYQAGTLQVHHEEMDKVPGIYPPGPSQVHSECSLPVFLQFPWPGE